MDEPKPKRPWWKRKQTWAALVVWLAVGYPLSAGPAAYCLGQGWIVYPVYRTAYAPLIDTERAVWPWPPDTSWDRYCTFCYSAGTDAASD